MNLANLIVAGACRHPGRPALSLGQAPHASYRQLARRLRAIAYGLRHRHDLLPGDRVALVMTNAPQFWEVLFGVWYAGLAAVPVNPKLHAREVQFILQHSGARLCVVTPDLHPAIGALAAQVETLDAVISVGDADYRRLRDADVPDVEMFPAQPTDLAWLFYTSGTTGRPKGAMLSHGNLLMMILAYFADIGTVQPTDCIVHAAPQSHGSGLWGLVHFAKAANNISPRSGGFDPAELAELLGTYQGVSLFAAPTMVNRLVAWSDFVSADLSRLNTITYGGAPMYLADLERALEVLGPRLAQIYGQGEAPMTITGLPCALHADTGHPRYRERLTSAGQARTGVEVRVVDDAGRPLGVGETGEVAVRGSVVMSGYWNDDAATAATLKAGFLHTGDVGWFDEEGFLTLLDRSKDLIISGGSNIYPREVEEVLLRHPAVKTVSVIGRPHPEWGEEVVACIAPRQAEACMVELDRLCLDHIARFKRPRAYLFLDSLPGNSTGKILKSELRALAEQAVRRPDA